MTNKKFYLVGMAVLLSVSLFVIGCPTEADAGPQGPQGNTFPPTLIEGASPALLAKYYADGATTVYLDAAPAAETFIVPENRTLTVVGDVALASGTVINAFEGTLDVAGGRFTGANGVLIVADAKAAEVKAKAVSLSVPAYLAAVPSPVTAITEDVVLESLTIDDGTAGVTAADFATFAGAAYNVYVTGDVVIDATTTALDTSSAKLTVYGDVTAKGSLTVGANTTIGKVTATGALTLAGSIDELDTAAFTVTSADLTIALDKLDSGTGGKLALTGNVTLVTIGAGNGIIEFNTGAPAFATTASSFGNTGLTTFKADVTAAKDITFDGPVAFEGDLTLTAAPATFKGNVSFVATKKITMTTAASIITLGPGVYLGLPTAANVPVVYGSVIANPGSTGNVTLTPANATKLTFVAGRSVEQGSSSGSAAHGITIGGNASLPAGATYTVASAATVIGTLTIDEDAELLLAAGVLVDSATDTTNSHTGASSKVVLTGAASTNGASLAGEGVVKAGATTITGGASGSWQAVGASSTFAIAVDAITASAAAALTGTDDDGAITVEGGRLTVIGKIDVATKGTITLKADSGGTAGSLLLKGGTVAGNLLTNSSASNPVTIGAGATAANFLLYATADSGKVKAAAVTKADGTSAIATATGIVVQGTVDSSAGAALGNIGGGDAADTKDVLITSKTTAANALVIVNTDALKVIVPNS